MTPVISNSAPVPDPEEVVETLVAVKYPAVPGLEIVNVAIPVPAPPVKVFTVICAVFADPCVRVTTSPTLNPVPGAVTVSPVICPPEFTEVTLNVSSAASGRGDGK